MAKIRLLVLPYMLSGLFFGLLALCLALCQPAEAQSTGNNAVYNGGSVVGSSAFIDALAFSNGPTGNDICAVLYNIIQPDTYPPNGAVIDARGFNTSNAPSDSNGNITCAYSPWSNGSNSTPNPATILLPFTQIAMQRTWVLPSGSRIAGKAPGFAPQAALQASSSWLSGTAMIQMGNSDCPFNGCTGVSVEHVTLDANVAGNGVGLDGIDNFSAQEQSYVDDVNLKNFGNGGVGINISAPNSGPYTNIRFTVSPCTASQCPSAAAVAIGAQTLGLHGITSAGPCLLNTQPNYPCVIPPAAIYANASNNSVEDVHVEGFSDAVEVGNVASTTVANITLTNINGVSSGYGGIINVVHICGPHSNSTYGACNGNSYGTVTEVLASTIQVTAEKYHQPSAVEDDVTGTTVASPTTGLPARVGLYFLGEPVPSGSATQYSRFSTSPNSNNASSTVPPTWGVGAVAPSGESCASPGAIYSNTAGSTGSKNTIFVCTGYYGSLTWQGIR